MKNKIKNWINSNIKYFLYFYQYLGYRILISILLSLFVGLLDGLGISMFIPLFQFVSESANGPITTSMGIFEKLIHYFKGIGFQLSLKMILLFLVIFFSFKGIFKYLEGLWRVRNEQFFISSQRITQIQLLSEYKYDSFVKSNPGRIQNSMSAEVDRISAAYRSFFNAFQFGIFIFAYFTMAFLANAQFAILLGLGGSISNYFLSKLIKATKEWSLNVTYNAHNFQGYLIQFVSFFKYLKATGLVDKYSLILTNQIRRISTANFKIGMIANILTSVREPILVSIVALVLFIEVSILNEKLIDLLLSLLLFYRALSYIMGFQTFWNQFLSYTGSLEGNQEFKKELSNGREHFGSKIFQGLKDKIEFKNVNAGYDSSTPIFDNLNLIFYSKKTVALIGISGSGKTTIINLLTGLISPIKGEIEFDDSKIHEFNVNTIRKKIGYITQDSIIFNDTLFNNISLWAKYNSENIERCREVLKLVSMEDFVFSYKENLNLSLGSNGINLSGGQKQRICIARELFKNPDILILDEATSALDSETEKVIQENIDKMRGEITIIIIAHRLSTIRNVDTIMLLGKGRIIDSGDYTHLLNNSNEFKKMVHMQSL